jgi:hypothetical protein
MGLLLSICSVCTFCLTHAQLHCVVLILGNCACVGHKVQTEQLERSSPIGSVHCHHSWSSHRTFQNINNRTTAREGTLRTRQFNNHQDYWRHTLQWRVKKLQGNLESLQIQRIKNMIFGRIVSRDRWIVAPLVYKF